MSKAFEADEVAAIQVQLIALGRELFGTIGLRKTTLEDLTRPLGIAKSSFYRFFPSKEELFIAVVYADLPRIDAEVAALLESSNSVRATLVQYMRLGLAELQGNPLAVRLLTHPDELQLLMRRLGPARMAELNANRPQLLHTFLANAQAQGALIAADLHVLDGVLRSIPAMLLLKDNIGAPILDDVIELLINMVADGMTATTKQASKHD